MHEIAVIYTSRYGTAKAYAEYIASELKADLHACKDLPAAKLSGYSTIIYGGGLYAGGISGIDYIKRNWSRVKEKRLIVFSVGFTPATRTDVLKKVIDSCFTESQQRVMSFYHFPGQVDYGKLTLLHQFALAARKQLLRGKKADKLTKESLAFLKGYGKPPQPLPFEAARSLIGSLTQTGAYSVAESLE